jgi:hypothetical protein
MPSSTASWLAMAVRSSKENSAFMRGLSESPSQHKFAIEKGKQGECDNAVSYLGFMEFRHYKRILPAPLSGSVTCDGIYFFVAFSGP